MIIQTTEHEFFTEITAAGLTRRTATLSHLWRLYLTFKRPRCGSLVICKRPLRVL